MKIIKKKDGTIIYSNGGFMSGLMNTVSRGLNWLLGRSRGGALASWLGIREVIPVFDQEKAISKGFNASLWLYAIISKNARKFASVPRYLYDEKALMEEKAASVKYFTKAANINKLFESDLNKLLERPNEYQGRSQFLAMLYAFYLSCGEGFIWLNRGDRTKRFDGDSNQWVNRTDKELDALPVLEMYVLPSNYVKVYTDPENVFGVTGYCLDVAGVKLELRKNDVIHWKDLNLKFDPTTGEHLRGMTRLEPGAKSVTENDEITRSAVRMYKNDGAKGIIYTKGNAEDISSEQESQIRSVVNAKINDNDVKGAVALLTGMEYGYIDLAVSSVDMNLLEGRVKNQQELCALFDTPHLLFIPADATLANLENAKRNWLNDTIIPATKELDDELNRRLLPAFGLVGKAKIISDFSELPELQQDMNKLVSTLSTAWWITPNQKLVAMGYEARPEEEFNQPWISGGARPLGKVLSDFEDDGFEEQLAEIEKRGKK